MGGGFPVRPEARRARRRRWRPPQCLRDIARLDGVVSQARGIRRPHPPQGRQRPSVQLLSLGRGQAVADGALSEVVAKP